MAKVGKDTRSTKLQEKPMCYTLLKLKNFYE